MPIRKSTIWLCSVLVLAALLAQPALVEAQCTTSYVAGMYTTMGMSVMYVLKYLSGSQNCTLTMQMGVIDCNPDPSGSTATLSATAYGTALSPSCGWACACGAVTIDANDNLPVELMEFSVEDDDEQATGADGGEDGAQEGGATGKDEKAS